jgi:hypothetical protein
MSFPQWATPERRAHLAKLAELTTHLYEIDLFTGKLRHPIIDGQGKRTVIAKSRYQWEMLTKKTPEGHEYHSLRPLGRLPHLVTVNDTGIIGAWKADDRARRAQLRKLEGRHLHAMPQIYKRGPFGTLEREQYHAQRPVFEIVAIGVSPFTQHRIAQVVIPGLHRTVWVDLHGVKLSKNKFHKLTRYKRGSVPKELVSQIEARVRQQVARFL